MKKRMNTQNQQSRTQKDKQNKQNLDTNSNVLYTIRSMFCSKVISD